MNSEKQVAGKAVWTAFQLGRHPLISDDEMPMVAREGFGWHYTLYLPVTGVYLDPRMDQRRVEGAR
jgi:hypothetical protein